MEAFNRILSLFVGLFIMILVIFFVVKRFNLQKTFPILGAKSPTLTPTRVVSQAKNTVTVDQTAESIKEKFNKTTTYTGAPYTGETKPTKDNKTQPATSIPETGVPTAVLPLALSGLFGGLYLRRKS